MPHGKELDAAALRELRRAHDLLEQPSLAVRLCDMAGTPIEKGMERLPAKVREQVRQATQQALGKALDVAVRSMRRPPRSPSRDRLHRACATACGGVGGMLGGAALVWELPLTTTIMLRSIADIARSEGEHVTDPVTGLACLEVLALGGRSAADDAAETGYYAVRASLAKAVADAAAYLAKAQAVENSAPALVRLMTSIAARFGVTVSQKAAAQLVPVIGAVGGAAVNAVFMDHYQTMARGHFIIRRLERDHGREAVQEAYEALRAERAKPVN